MVVFIILTKILVLSPKTIVHIDSTADSGEMKVKHSARSS